MQAHGLRKAAARRLAEAGLFGQRDCNVHRSQTLAEVERYTQAVDQERLARQAIQRQSTSKSGKPPADELANVTDASLEINRAIAKVALPRGIEPLFQP
jgi:hypothetical protein